MTSILTAHSIKREINTLSGLLTILDDVSVELKAGESVAIQGASGSGKSTLLGILAGLDTPQSGQVFIDGHNITQLGEDQRADLRADKVGFVFQSFYLVDDLTALENVALPLELFGHERPFEQAADWLGRLGLGDRAKHYPAQLSGGEQQRVALCRAFAVRPRLLFADEPTANLDKLTADAVLDQLFALQREVNTAMVIATHDAHLAKRCHRILRLQAGRLVTSDDHE
jgi:putative ABC transport system ATP-binding protein